MKLQWDFVVFTDILQGGPNSFHLLSLCSQNLERLNDITIFNARKRTFFHPGCESRISTQAVSRFHLLSHFLSFPFMSKSSASLIIRDIVPDVRDLHVVRRRIFLVSMTYIEAMHPTHTFGFDWHGLHGAEPSSWQSLFHFFVQNFLLQMKASLFMGQQVVNKYHTFWNKANLN